MSLAQIPLRLVSGAFVLNSGLGKRHIPDEVATALRDMGAQGVPAVADMSPAQFRKFLSTSEIAVGAAQLLPFVPGWVAGAAMTGFSGALTRMYLKTPGFTEDDGVRPTSDGTPFAKDIMFLAAGVAILLDDLVNGSRRKRKKAAKRLAKLADARKDKVEAIHEAQTERVDAIRDARKQLKADRKEMLRDVKKARA